MTSLVITLLVFVTVAATGLAANLLLGWLVRPDRPSAEKGQPYECGEEPIGTAWVQFDLRFYVMALLFIIFDVEIAFFFPWAVAFGSSHRLTDAALPPESRLALTQQLAPAASQSLPPEVAGRFAQFAFAEMLVFFVILMIGFAYVWSRGDLDWVTSTAGQPQLPEPTASQVAPRLMTSARLTASHSSASPPTAGDS